jgi:hypothetical protein
VFNFKLVEMTGKKNEVAKIGTKALPTKLGNFNNMEEALKWAEVVIESGLVPDSITAPEQVVTIVQHGKELGLSPHIALNNLHVIAGRPVISSAMLGALLKRNNIEWVISEDFATVERDGVSHKQTTYKFFWKSNITGSVLDTDFSITWAQMELAGYTSKSNWNKYPKEMMRARCMAYAVRALFPEILSGIYSDLEINDVAEELGAEEQEVIMNEEGDVTIVTGE